MSTVGLDGWTEERCIRLIREYRKRPILWDQKNPLYFVRAMKMPAWEELGTALDTSADQCKHKMIILMSSLRREKAKIKQKLKKSSDSCHAYKSTWFAFKEMAFLLDKESERKRQLNDTDEVEEDEDDDDDNTKLKLLQHQLDTLPRAKKITKVSKTDNEQLTSNTSRLEREACAVALVPPIPGPSHTTIERDEEIKSFVSFIGNKMKKYSNKTKNSVQQAICDIIFKADQNFYEKNCYEKFTIINEETDPINTRILDEDQTFIKMKNDSDSD